VGGSRRLKSKVSRFWGWGSRNSGYGVLEAFGGRVLETLGGGVLE